MDGGDGNGFIQDTHDFSDVNGNKEKINGFSTNPRFKKSTSMLDFSKSKCLIQNFGKNERKVLVIYTGGTIGMMYKGDGCK